MDAFQIILKLGPVLLQAINIICTANGTTVEQAVDELIAHLTPSQPNSAALSPTSASTK